MMAFSGDIVRQLWERQTKEKKAPVYEAAPKRSKLPVPWGRMLKGKNRKVQKSLDIMGPSRPFKECPSGVSPSCHGSMSGTPHGDRPTLTPGTAGSGRFRSLLHSGGTRRVSPDHEEIPGFPTQEKPGLDMQMSASGCYRTWDGGAPLWAFTRSMLKSAIREEHLTLSLLPLGS
jgi:hypothetical protein